jgi:hypothetical protein
VSLFKELVLLPVAPLRFTVWVAEQLADEADRRQNSPAARAQQLRRIDEARRRGEIDEEEAATLEGEMLESAMSQDDTSGTSVIGRGEENEDDG